MLRTPPAARELKRLQPGDENHESLMTLSSGTLTSQPSAQAGKSRRAPPAIAILPWGDFIEDFLDTIGLSLEDFAYKMTGGWLFGYIDALRLQGIRSTIFCFSKRVQSTVRMVHKDTGAEIIILRASVAYRKIRERLEDPYASHAAQMFGATRGFARFGHKLIHPIVSYLATPMTSLAREIHHSGCTAILCQEYETPRFDTAIGIGMLLRIPVFATFQGGNWHRSRIERRLRPRMLRQSAGLIIASSVEAKRVRQLYGIAGKKISSIFNPLDLAEWRPGSQADARRNLGIAEGARVAVWHGRIDIRAKGLDVLLEAWQQVCAGRHGRDLLLLMAGSGRDAQEFDEEISRRSVTQIRWIRDYVLSRTAMREYLIAADVYVFSSRHEGFALAPLEAMACGLPVVAACASGIADIFGDAEEFGGVVVPVEDAASLAKNVGRLLDDSVDARVLGARARSRVEQAFSTDKVGAQLRDLFFPGP
jgi:glycosyltransferase involved in cell wall biosynthesis